MLQSAIFNPCYPLASSRNVIEPMALSSCLVESAHPLSRHSQHRHSAVERNILKIERMHLQGSLRYVPKVNWVYFNYPCCQLTLATVFYVQKHVWLIIVQSCIKATVYHAQDSLRTVSCLHKIFNDIDRLWISTPYLPHIRIHFRGSDALS